MKMNLPNKLTLARVIMVPFFVAALLYREGDSTPARMLALGLFLVASFTDFLDGYIARKYHHQRFSSHRGGTRKGDCCGNLGKA